MMANNNNKGKDPSYFMNNKMKKTKSFDNKINIKKKKYKVDKKFLENIKKNDKKCNEKTNFGEIKRKHKLNPDLIIDKNNKVYIKSKNKNINTNINENEEKVKDSFYNIKEEKLNDNSKEEIINENIENDDNNNINKGEGKEDIGKKSLEKEKEKEVPMLILSSEKKSNNKDEENENDEKEKTPLLILDSNSNSSSTGNSYQKGIVTNSDYTESVYESEGLEIKGELLTKTKKQNFLNNLKKCLFNKEISSNDKMSNSNINTNINNEDEDCHFNNTIELKKRKTADFSHLSKINLKQNISLTESQLGEKKTQIKSFVITQPGLNDNKLKINQDSYLILENIFEQKLNIFGVFDGHGKNGHLISNLVSQFLSKYFIDKKNYYIPKKNEIDTSDIDSSISIKSDDITINNEELTKIFSDKNNFVENTIKKLVEKANECNFNLEFSGTTCVLLFILGNKLICSNIGDSQCVVFNCSNEDRWTHEIVSVIHKPDVPKEKERILENGGVIHPYYDENGIYEGPDRVYVKNKTYPGLCLTRSIGDILGEEVGIISDPDIIIKNIDSTCKFIVLGSDGLWDMIKPYDIQRIVNPYFNKGDPEGACNALLKRANKMWEKDESERDDITIIVIFIGMPNKT
jgi:serine/threonine protein phosphatase PrpC